MIVCFSWREYRLESMMPSIPPARTSTGASVSVNMPVGEMDEMPRGNPPPFWLGFAYSITRLARFAAAITDIIAGHAIL